MLDALHDACREELRAIVSAMPLERGEHVLDAACGAGAYALWLAERVGPSGEVVAVDMDPAFLAVARQRCSRSPSGRRVRFEPADVERLPFADQTFDAAWCAHSLYSLPDPAAVLTELRRVLKAGGRLGLLENDSQHYLLLPWPPDLDLAVQRAQLAALAAETPNAPKFYAARRLKSLFLAAGFADCRVSTYTIDHQAPLSRERARFLGCYLADLAARVRPFLAPRHRRIFETLVNPCSEDYLPGRPDFFATEIEVLSIGWR